MSQEHVSKRLGKGFSLASVYRWEAGVDLPTFDKMTRLAMLYGKSLDWLAGWTNCREVFDYGKVVVDREALSEIDEAVESSRSIDHLMPELIRGAGLNCAWPVPRQPMMLDREAAIPIQHRLDEAYRRLCDF